MPGQNSGVSLASRVASRVLRLPAATNRVSVERDIKVAMPDGVVLLADHYSPVGTEQRPTILVRSPYGRASFNGLIFGRLVAERGYHVVVQSCRGTFGSGGDFNPVRQEAADGRATIEWIARQDWFDGRLGTLGASYLGYTQWAVAGDPPVPIRSMAIAVSASRTQDRVYRGGSFSLADSLGWAYLIANQERSRLAAVTTMVTSSRRLGPLWNRLPLADLDRQAIGKPVPYYQNWLAHSETDDPFWDATDFRSGLEASTAEFHLVGGWYDIFLPDTVADYLELRRLGRRPRLVIGPWTHVQALNSVVLNETLDWMHRTLANGAVRDGRPSVRLQLGGSREWLDFDDWPAPADVQAWHLQPRGALSREAPADSAPDRYRYDPADPTPSLGGALLNPGTSGPKNNRSLEARPDVVVYTSEPLPTDLKVVGPVTADLFVRSSLQSTDFFARLCDVDEGGRSINVSDGLLRLRSNAGEGDIRRIRIDLWPAGHCFRRGHRLRVQISSGAHPRFARNLGLGEPLGSGTNMRAADQEIFHDPARPSAVLLPRLP
jgi:putative CocE/NonD family hydrolase